MPLSEGASVALCHCSGGPINHHPAAAAAHFLTAAGAKSPLNLQSRRQTERPPGTVSHSVPLPSRVQTRRHRHRRRSRPFTRRSDRQNLAIARAPRFVPTHPTAPPHKADYLYTADRGQGVKSTSEPHSLFVEYFSLVRGFLFILSSFLSAVLCTKNHIGGKLVISVKI